MNDALRTGTGLLHGIPVALAVMEFGFMGGSMGSVVGEKLTRLIEYATQVRGYAACFRQSHRHHVGFDSCTCQVAVLLHCMCAAHTWLYAADMPQEEHYCSCRVCTQCRQSRCFRRRA